MTDIGPGILQANIEMFDEGGVNKAAKEKKREEVTQKIIWEMGVENYSRESLRKTRCF